MGALIWIIDKVLIHKGKKALSELEKSCEDPIRANEELLLRILRENANTEYGRKYNFASIKSVDDYRKMVPFSNYDVYEPYIRRMVRKCLIGTDNMH